MLYDSMLAGSCGRPMMNNDRKQVAHLLRGLASGVDTVWLTRISVTPTASLCLANGV